MSISKSGKYEKPFFFLDVDGPINVSKKGSKGKPGKLAQKIKVKIDGEKFIYDGEVIPILQKLNRLYQIVWASHGWRGREDDFLSPILHLPKNLPQLPVDYVHDPIKGDMPFEKFREIVAFADGKPYAICDDKLGPYVEAYALTRDICLVPVNPRRGLSDADLWILQQFVKKMKLKCQNEV